MSTLLASKQTIHTVAVWAALSLHRGALTDDLISVAGLYTRRLHLENVRAVKAVRPGHEEDEPEWVLRRMTVEELDAARGLPAIVVLKTVQFYEYQACDSPDWSESTARSLSNNATAAAVAKLPGYDRAPWGLHEGCNVTVQTPALSLDKLKGLAEVKVEYEPEDEQPKDHFDPMVGIGSPGAVESIERAIAEAGGSPCPMWFCAKVTASYAGFEGEPQYLGCCSYLSYSDFESSGCDGMEHEALKSLHAKLNDAFADLSRLVA